MPNFNQITIPDSLDSCISEFEEDAGIELTKAERVSYALRLAHLTVAHMMDSHLQQETSAFIDECEDYDPHDMEIEELEIVAIPDEE